MDPPTMDMAFTSVAQFFSKAPQMQSEDLQNGYVWSSFKTSDQFCFVRMPINYLDEALLEAESARSSTLVPLHPLQNSAHYGAISTQHDNQTIDPRVLQSMEDALSFDPNTPNSYQATGQPTQNNVPTLTIGSPTLGNWPLFGGYTYPDPTNLEGLHGVQPTQQTTSSGNNALGGRRVRSRASASSSNNAPRTRRVRVPASASSSNNAPRPRARTYAPRATQAQHTAMQALEGAQDILRNVFNVTIGQPFNPGWMEDNNVDHAILKGLVCVPSRVKWEVICNWGLFQPGDLLHVPTAAATTGAASVSTDATLVSSKFRPDVRVAPATPVNDGILHSCTGPTKLLQAMKAAHPQLNRPGIGKLGWKVLHLVRGGRDLGDLFHIRAAWCLWIEQHAALVGGGKYPALSGKK